MILVYITNPTEKDAENIAEILIDKKLIACGNIFPIKSVYRWEGELKKEQEWVLLGKTEGSLYKDIEFEVEKVHPYKIPCILKLEAQGNESYQNWIEGELK